MITLVANIKFITIRRLVSKIQKQLFERCKSYNNTKIERNRISNCYERGNQLIIVYRSEDAGQSDKLIHLNNEYTYTVYPARIFM